MSLSSAQVASAPSDATRRSSSHKQKGQGTVSLKTHDRLIKPSGKPNRKRKRGRSSKLTPAKPVQTRNHIKPSSIHVNKRKEKKHHTEERISRRSSCNKPLLRLSELKSRRDLTSVQSARSPARDRTTFEVISDSSTRSLLLLSIKLSARSARNASQGPYTWLSISAFPILAVCMRL